MTTSRIAVFAAFAAFSAVTVPMAAAQSPNSPEAILASGDKSLQEGKHSLAAQQFSRAMRSEALSSEQIALAFYRRGQAQRALGKYALAIADFNNALWIDELPEAEKNAARQARAEAYAALGRSDHEQTTVAHGASPSASAPRRRTASAAPARTAEPAPQPTRSEPATTASLPPRAPAALAPTSEPTGSWSTSVNAGAAAQAATAAPQPQQSRSRIGRFFSGLRGTIMGSDEPAERPAEVGATPTTSTEATGQWSANTSVAASSPQSVGSEGGGRYYLLQLASVDSEADAQAAWQDISGKAENLVGDHEPQIQKTDLGTLGTAYRVQIGPFADKRETLKLCNALKASGVDCFLVTR